MTQQFASAQIRIARPTRNLRVTRSFYEAAVGFSVLAEWEEHEGYDGVVLAIGGPHRQLELLQHESVEPTPSTEDQIVLYLGSGEAVAVASKRIRDHGHTPVLSPNPYWARDGAVCFVDPDGYWLVLSPSAWKAESSSVNDG